MDTLAARLREAFLGTETGEVVPFDNLKDHVRDRWQRVADAAAIRVPFSDAQIERMAKAHMGVLNPGANWEHADKQYHMNAIRAALAAGGLEPCAVPEYDPDDVALTPIERVLRKRLADVDAKVERQRKNLHQLYTANADLRDQLAAADLDLADKAFYIREFAAVSAERDGLQKRNDVQAEQLRRLDSEISPLMSEIAAMRERASVDPPADQVEALARVLFTALHGENFAEQNPFWNTNETTQGEMRNLARAAIAHLAKRPEGLPTAEDIKYLPGKPHVFNNELLIAAYKALKTRHALEWGDETNKDGWQRVLDVVRNATYETLRPWLRDPVGFELNVTAKEMMELYYEKGHALPSMQAVLDLCRSRISPTYECKECAGRAEGMMRPQPEIRCAGCEHWESNFNNLKHWYDLIETKLNAARAALEGE